jgi:HprK-related kinase A
MPLVSSLPPSELSRRLKQPGLFLQTGTFVICVHTSIPSVVEGIALLYADYPLAECSDFADFHVSLVRPKNLRRWYRPQVVFSLDGKSPFKPLPLDQAFPMFEWGLNWCVSSYAHSHLIVHAAVVEKDGYAAILPAPPGSGKSTLCAALVCRGWRLLSDELALISVSDGQVVPLPRPVSLKNASIAIIKDYEPSAIMSNPVTDTMKGTVAHMKVPTQSIARADVAAQPAWIVFPKYMAGAEPRLEPLPQSRAFLRVAENAFNFNTLGVGGFTTLENLIDKSRCFEFSYSRLDDAIHAFDDLNIRTGCS